MSGTEQATPETFRRWLLRQVQRDDGIGDLARDLRADRDYRGQTWRGLLRRLHELHACEGAIESCWQAGREWGQIDCGAEEGDTP